MFELDNTESKLEHASYDRICKRCQLLISIDHIDCPHCEHLSNSDLIVMLNKRIQQQEENAGLGRVFFLVSIVISIIFFCLY